MDQWIQSIIERQIQNKKISASEAEIYQYGYRLLIEKICVFILTIGIGIMFHAWWEVFLFCIAFIPLRVYSGGYHTKKSISCMLLSVTVLISNVFLVQGFASLDMGKYLVTLELPFFILLNYFSPIETVSRKIEVNEKKFFHKMVFFIYVIEILAEILFILFGYDKFMLSFLVAHGFNAITVLSEVILQKISL